MNHKSCFGICYEEDPVCNACEGKDDCKIKFKSRELKSVEEGEAEADEYMKKLQ
jgi:hypothetical protein